MIPRMSWLRRHDYGTAAGWGDIIELCPRHQEPSTNGLCAECHRRQAEHDEHERDTLHLWRTR